MAAHRTAGLTSPLVRVLDDLSSTFDLAVERCGVVEHRRVLAGRVVRLRFAGDALVPAVLAAFEHLPVAGAMADDEPELTVAIWDTASSGTRLPDSPLVPRAAEQTLGPLYRNGDLRFLLQCGERALSALDADRSTAYHCLPDAELPVQHRGAPLRSILSWWLRDRGCNLVHSAALADERGAVLLTGPSGAGKSTTALDGAAAGLDYLGDDYVVVDPARAVVHSAYRTAKVVDPRRASGADKSLAHLDAVPGPLPVRAVALPRVAGGTSALGPATAGRALLALAPSTLLQLPGEEAATLRALRSFLESVPCHELALGDDAAGTVPALLRSLLDAP